MHSLVTLQLARQSRVAPIPVYTPILGPTHAAVGMRPRPMVAETDEVAELIDGLRRTEAPSQFSFAIGGWEWEQPSTGRLQPIVKLERRLA
jgi:hypothetical protein